MESVDAVSVVVKEKSTDVDEVHDVAFGKGKRFSSESADALTQGEVETLNVVCLSLLLGTGAVLVIRHNLLVGAPEVGENEAGFVGGRNLVPQLSATIHSCRQQFIEREP